MNPQLIVFGFNVHDKGRIESRHVAIHLDTLDHIGEGERDGEAIISAFRHLMAEALGALITERAQQPVAPF